MYLITDRKELNESVVLIKISSPLVAEKALAGQFVILRVDENGERIPLTISDTDPAAGTVSLIFQIVGATTKKLAALNAGEAISDFAGPLGRPTELEGIKRAVVIGGGVGSAIAYPVAKALHMKGAAVDTVTGFRNADMVILEKEFMSIGRSHQTMTDDGSYGTKGLVTDALKKLLEKSDYDCVFAIGPLVMMKYVSLLTKEFGVRTVVSMNPVMIDGTGMCGGCRLTVGGKKVFACVDGPDFDGHEVDFDEAIKRSGIYRDFEAKAYEKACRLFKKA